MQARGQGWHELTARAKPGDRYGYRLDDEAVRPDPASRRQPDGVHGLSAIVDLNELPWSDAERTWRPPPVAAGAVYELHVGTFTADGTLDAAREHLPHVRALGVTHVEVMPLNAFNGPHGWGYDGVAWYAVHEPYGGPDAFVRFVDACHQHDLAVVLDVVYNHLGPSGSYLPEFGPYLTEGRASHWGEGINVYGPGSDAVRRFIVDNALMWLRDYHVDALRLDAVHALHDTSALHVLAELAGEVDALSRLTGRRSELIAESDRNDPATVRPREAGGLGLDAQWADDLHHAIHVALTEEDEGYYADYDGLADVARAYTSGFVFDGHRYSTYRGRTAGAPLGDVPATRLVACIQNHDQVGNRARGDRLTTLVDAPLVRAAAVLLCAAPHVPMLFMGEEYGETNPFQYFTSHPEADLAEAVRTGRASEFAAFSGFAGDVPDPQDPATFARSRLDWSRAQRPEGIQRLRLWQDLLALRHGHAALSNGRRDLVEVRSCGAQDLVILRGDPGSPPVLVTANLGTGPLVVASPGGQAWEVVLSTDDVRYGGDGRLPRTVEQAGDLALEVPARTAVLWTPAT